MVGSSLIRLFKKKGYSNLLTRTKKQLNLSFSNPDDAISWCNSNGFAYRVVETLPKKIKPKSYASNFSNQRRTSWTH